MEEGWLKAYVDFFYITTNTTPSEIEPSAKLQEEYKLNKRKKLKFQQNEQSLIELKTTLVEAEDYHRNGNTKECLKSQSKIA